MDAKQRFSDRVENYIRYRPSYPSEITSLLQQECALNPASVVADIGAGTGMLALPFLRLGCRVYGVEPNREMRLAGQRLLADQPNYIALDGSAEDTGLPTACADFVTAGQAFHWFDAHRAGIELRRILRPGGWAVLVWNERRTGSTPFLRAYEELLLRYATDYGEVNHRNTEEDPHKIPDFFSGDFRTVIFANTQIFDLEGVCGRLMSSSYAPLPGHPNHAPMMAELEAIFSRCQSSGHVAFEYDTQVFYGHLSIVGPTKG
jgi:SAM-dependent methyltransferase